jgi:hypothetical protein
MKQKNGKALSIPFVTISFPKHLKLSNEIVTNGSVKREITEKIKMKEEFYESGEEHTLEIKNAQEGKNMPI